MPNERLILAIGQMERALSRLESAQARVATLPNTDSPSDLALRHERLKAAASQALTGIDALLEGKG